MFKKLFIFISLLLVLIPSQMASAVPLINSRPDATAVIYLDFDGEVITEKEWDLETRTLASFNLPDSEISDITNRVADDFSAFNINITTEESRYYNAPVGKRMRMIVTPTQLYPPSVNVGIAYTDSFSGAGKDISFYPDKEGKYTPISPTIPCFVFFSEVNTAAEAISHELGHTLGLKHKGNSQNSRNVTYFGHGPEGAVDSWAPIMGSGRTRQLSHWSNGEYSVANNKDDELAIISGTINGFGYVNDDFGNSTQNAQLLNTLGIVNRNVLQSGLISTRQDTDFFEFSTTNGEVNFSASSPLTTKPNLDIELKLWDNFGNLIKTGNPVGLSSALSATVTPGKYFLSIDGVGVGDGVTSGYSDYGSLGNYQITGNIPPNQTPSAATGAIISEFRFHGTSSTDEYVEIYNTLGSPLNVSGWAIQTNSGSSTNPNLQLTVIPDNTIIPMRGHLLFANPNYTLNDYGVPDVLINGDISDDSGVTLYNSLGAIQDAVGFTSSLPILREETGLQSAPIDNGQYTFVRDYAFSLPKNTSNSSQDFIFLSTNSAPVNGTNGSLTSQLGTPSPEGLKSPIYINNMVTTLLLDPSFDQAVSPNRVRTGGLNQGTILVRRRIVNKSGKTLYRIRLNVTKITTLNSPNTVNAQADVRLISSQDEMNVPVSGGTVNVFGTRLEQSSIQPLAGGHSSSINFDSILSTPLAPNETRCYSFLLAVVKSGNFSVALNIQGQFTP